MKKKSESTGKKKTVDNHKDMAHTLLGMLDKINTGIHQELSDTEELVDKYELGGYFDSDNMPDINKIDESDIGVKEVCIVGMASNLRGIHENFHSIIDDTAKELGIDLHADDGKGFKIKELSGKKVPPEVMELVEGIAEVIEKNRKKREDKK